MACLYKALHNYYLDLVFDATDATAYTNAYFGQGSGSIHIDDVSCTGTESRLIDCSYDSNTADCSHAQDAGVQCQPSTFTSL